MRRVAVDLDLPLRTLVVAAAVVALSAAVVSIVDAFVVVFIGIFLALVFEIPVRWFSRRTGIGRSGSATIVVLGSVVTVAVVCLIVFVRIVGSVRDFLQSLPELVEELRESDELSWIGGAGGENVQEGATNVSSSIPDAISAVLGITGSAFGIMITLFSIIFLALFLLVDMHRLQSAIASVLFPPEDTRWLGIWERVTRTVSAWAIGAALIAVIAGTVQGTTAFLLGSSYALALGVIAGVLDLIPNIGATIAGFILVPTLLAEEGVTAAVIMLVVVLVYQQVENNLLTPTIQGRAVNISAFLIILGVTLFGALLGPLGALVAVPVMGSLQIVLMELTADRRARVEAAHAALEPPPEPPAPAAVAEPAT